ncbi:MAG: sigma-54-dependent Fis family transcriptional regulator [Kofleriaceae bacterium]|nr:sigma-54-dependent Fis family transcriptional regulator [Kofleriaceae bacterium]
MTLGDKPLILLVDDDPSLSALVGRWLELAEFRVEYCESAEALLDLLSRTLPDAVCLDLDLPGMGGMEVLSLLRRRHRTVPIIMLTGDKSIHSVVQAMQAGAYDYVPKPPDRARLVNTVSNAVKQHHMSTRLAQLEREVDGTGFDGIIGQSPVMRDLFRQLEKVAMSDITSLIHGESGTGKELIAGAIHKNSARSSGPFVAVNCAAVPETLQDSQFFGHEKGAFTGATKTQLGRFEQANGGTLFLDEIAELNPTLQAKLLRVIQEKNFQRVGGSRVIHSDFRLVAATNRDLADMVRRGTFRDDLYFRIAVLELEIPPLRDRKGDLDLLVNTFLSEIANAGNQPKAVVSSEAMTTLAEYSWPGNVRELLNVIQRAVVMAENNFIASRDLPSRLLNVQGKRPPADEECVVSDAPRGTPPPDPGEYPMTLVELERWAIETMMERTGGNVSEVIRRLKIGRTTLYRKLKRYGLR